MGHRLEKLKRELLSLGQKITILGHGNIDFDAFVSGILLSRLFTHLGISNEFILLEKPPKNDTYRFVKEVVGVRMETYYVGSKENATRNLVLVDHYETTHKGTVFACIDHHPHQKELAYPFYYFKNSCATAYLIYKLMEFAGYPFKQEEIQWVMVSMVTDTSYFKSGKVVQREISKMKRIGKQYHLYFTEMKKYGLSSTRLYKLNLKKVIENGKKQYTFCGKTIISSYIQIGEEGKPLTNFYLKCCLHTIQRQRIRQAIFLWVFIVYDLQKNATYLYKVGEGMQTVKREEEILSRGTDIMPRIEKEIEGNS